MKRAIIFAAVLVMLVCGSAHANVVNLVAKPEVRAWHSHQSFPPTQTIEVVLRVNGYALEEQAERPCELEWIGKGIAARASLCSKHRAPLTLHYVGFGRPVAFRLAFFPLNR